ncbi:hypothetical protein SESBI_24373 [Sesbania bispinosa]|nr:hypothetical protein SESBI_24373 [Sesbania bispinosa]
MSWTETSRREGVVVVVVYDEGAKEVAEGGKDDVAVVLDGGDREETEGRLVLVVEAVSCHQ